MLYYTYKQGEVPTIERTLMSYTSEEATQQTVHWVYKDSYPMARRGLYIEAEAIARKIFEEHPQSVVIIEKQVLIKQEIKSFHPYRTPEAKRREN